MAITWEQYKSGEVGKTLCKECGELITSLDTLGRCDHCYALEIRMRGQRKRDERKEKAKRQV